MSRRIGFLEVFNDTLFQIRYEITLVQRANALKSYRKISLTLNQPTQAQRDIVNKSHPVISQIRESHHMPIAQGVKKFETIRTLTLNDGDAAFIALGGVIDERTHRTEHLKARGRQALALKWNKFIFRK